MHHDHAPKGPYGLMAEFLQPEDLLAAARRATAEGYTAVDAYSPFPVHGVDEAIGARTHLPWLIFFGGLAGGIGGFAMQAFASAVHYKIDIAGKPYVSWPSFMPITFELTVLVAASTAVFGMLFLNGFPKPYDPVFNVPEFKGASQDRFFLCIRADDPKFSLETTSRFLESLEPKTLTEVPF
ncbi:DUF3341 domain-containing protein [Tundrisphaera sp. TA3]|uniref:DUF3341 domain-containing protein n=1 Tax=Tundrisphaera sp. TA3 TaxID=3435775 RepID=UPI003EC05916